MANHKPDAGAVDGRDHVIAVCERERHGLLDDGVFAVGRRHDDMFGMALVRCGDVDGVDVLIAKKLLGVAVDLGVKFAAELFQRLGAQIGGGDQFNLRMVDQTRQHGGCRAAQTNDAEIKNFVISRRHSFSH